MQHFPYATLNSPQSKYYVILEVYEKTFCGYKTAWKYGGVDKGFLSDHWYNDDQFKIHNYIKFDSQMIHSNTSVSNEDYWYSVNNCTLDSGESCPCQEIFFKKDTEIPLRYRYIRHNPMPTYQVIINYDVISIGKPDDRFFETIPKNWMDNCADLNLGLDLNESVPIVHINESIVIPIRLSSPPHRVNGNDTMILQWEVHKYGSECIDCITWQPKEFYFNIENFHQYQNLTLTRVKRGPQTIISPIARGGGFEQLGALVYLLVFRSE
jgi:hypothetical protein